MPLRSQPVPAIGSRVWQWTTKWSSSGRTTRRWRERRYRRFLELCQVRPQDRILDVGAGTGSALERFNAVNEITAVDIRPRATRWLSGPNVTVQYGDGTRLPFEDGAFPVVFSNSVIEHVPRELQRSFADEIRRVSERYYVQTPNRFFPIEPHYQLPLVQFLPRRVLFALSRRFNIGWMRKGEWEEIHLLSASDLRSLFPDGEIHRERLLGLTKSLMAVRRSAGRSSASEEG
jgi:SAM-dependent methyltransferase